MLYYQPWCYSAISPLSASASLIYLKLFINLKKIFVGLAQSLLASRRLWRKTNIGFRFDRLHKLVLDWYQADIGKSHLPGEFRIVDAAMDVSIVVGCFVSKRSIFLSINHLHHGPNEHISEERIDRFNIDRKSVV